MSTAGAKPRLTPILFLLVGASILTTNYWGDWQPGDTLSSGAALVLVLLGWATWALARHRLGRFHRLADSLYGILVGAAFVALVNLFVASAAVIPSASMAPILLPGDFVLTERLTLGFVFPYRINRVIGEWIPPRRGDIVLARSPIDRKNYIVKRIVACPGDVIAVDQEGHAIINDDPKLDVWGNFTGAYLDLDAENKPTLRAFGPVQLQRGEYFLMGDNRKNSIDSRYWGPVPREMILARVRCIYFSWDDGPRLERIEWL